MGIVKKAVGFAKTHKKGLAIAGATALGIGALGYGAKKLFGRRGVSRSRGLGKLKTSIQRLRLRTIKLKEQKKLFREQLKV